MDRINDIQALEGGTFRVAVDGHEVEVAPGEPVIAVLSAVGLQGFSRNNHGVRTGGYCWMGVCHSCTVKIDGVHGRRACQTIVQPGMRIDTGSNRFGDGRGA